MGENLHRSLPLQRCRGLLGQIAETRRMFMAAESLLDPAASSSPCLAITSAAPEEGKTLVLTGLATAAVQETSKPVLAMDLNWYRPALHQYFGLERTFKVHDLAANDAVRRYARPCGIQGLDILAAPLPCESKEAPIQEIGGGIARLIREARAAYGMVFLDCHSIFPANRHMIDPVSLGRLSDLVVLVVLAGVTPRQDA